MRMPANIQYKLFSMVANKELKCSFSKAPFCSLQRDVGFLTIQN